MILIIMIIIEIIKIVIIIIVVVVMTIITTTKIIKKSFNDRNNNNSDNESISNNNNSNSCNSQKSMEGRKNWLEQEIGQATNTLRKIFVINCHKHYPKMLVTSIKEKKIKKIGINITPFMNHYPNNGSTGDNDPLL